MESSFSYGEIELEEMTKAQTVCQILASDHFPLQDMAQTGFMCFLNSDIELTELTLGQVHDPSSGHMQSLY